MDFINFSTSALAPASAEASRTPTPPRPKTPPKNLRKKYKMSYVLGPRGDFKTSGQKEAQKAPPGRPKWSQTGPPAPPWRLKSPQDASPGRTPARQVNFLAPPGGSRSGPGPILERSWGVPWAHMAARSALGGFGPSFWSLRGPSREHFGNHFKRFSV